jgi:hypothetical protein
VQEVLEQWLATEHRYFKLSGDDGGVYIVSYYIAPDRCDSILFDHGPAPETRPSST